MIFTVGGEYIKYILKLKMELDMGLNNDDINMLTLEDQIKQQAHKADNKLSDIVGKFPDLNKKVK